MQELVFKIIYVILSIIGLGIIYIIAKNITKAINNKNLILRDVEMYKIKYSEEEISAHLDFIINECFDFYIVMNLMPKNLDYINNNTEKEIIKHLSEIVPERISSTLYSQLSLIYNSNQVPKIIAEKIYSRVLEYVLNYNIQNKK